MTIRSFAALSLLVFSTIAATDVAPTNAELEAMYDRAFRAFDAANYDQALKELDAIDARKPDLAASQNLRGVIYMRQGIFDKAEAALSESQRLDPKFWNARFNLAEIPFLKKDWPEARKRFQELLSSNAADLQGEATQLIQYKILLTYLIEGNETLVDSILAKFELAPDTPAAHYANAAIALQKQNVPEARNWMSAAEKNFSPQLNKLFAESLFEVGWLQQQPGQQRTALQLLSPEERASGTKAMAQSELEQAQQAYEQRDFERAAKLAEQADTAQPNQPPVLNLRGEILLEQGKFGEAESYFSKALKVDGKFREAQFNLADVPFRQKDYDKARERFQALLKQTPGGDKNQAAQLINFKIYMTYLLEGKDSRAQSMMEQFQFSGDTPALYYAEAAWEFKHGKNDTANDWIASARKIYPVPSNAAYSTGFYDLGWLKSGASSTSSPAPSAAVDAAAVASAQTESPAPAAIEPSPIPGAEAKTEENGFVSAQTQQVAGGQPTTAPASTAPKTSDANANKVVASAGSPARPEDVPAVPSGGISPVVEMPSATAAPSASLPASAAPVKNLAQASVAPSPAQTAAPSAPASASPVIVAQTTPAAALAPANAPFVQSGSGEQLDRLTNPRTLLSIALLVGGVGILAWMGISEIRRRLQPSAISQRPAPATGPGPDAAESTEPMAKKAERFSGGPRKVSVQLKASEPSLERGGEKPAVEAELKPQPLAEEKSVEEVAPQPVIAEESFAEPVLETAPASSTSTDGQSIAGDETRDEETPSAGSEAEPLVSEPSSRFADLGESVGPVVEQGATPEPASNAETDSELIPGDNGQEPMLGSLLATTDEEAEEKSVTSSHEVALEPELTTADEEITPAVLAESIAAASVTEEPEVDESSEVMPESLPSADKKPGMPPVREVSATVIESTVPEVMAESVSKKANEPAVPEPVAQGQPVPFQTVLENVEEPARTAPAAEDSELRRVSAAIAGLGALRGAMPASEPEKEFPSQPTTIQSMPETQTAPVIRTPAGSTQPSPVSPAAAAGGMHTAVHITLSCEIASMQLTPSFKMGALQLRPISKVVTMRLAAGQQQQEGMNLQVNFEIAKVQPAPGSLGQVRLSPSQQQKPATLSSPSFNISGLQVVSGFEQAPLQLTPSQQGQASVHLTAAFQITTVEFSPTFEIAAMILNSSSKTVAVQLPGAAGAPGDSGPLFEVANVQLTSNGDIAMLQLNPAATRRA
ncbi:MAG: tetratricopeptide repeat protein [Chthoniobacterales bacterium]